MKNANSIYRERGRYSMLCPSCHTRNQFYNNYCYYCGYKLRDNKDRTTTVEDRVFDVELQDPKPDDPPYIHEDSNDDSSHKEPSVDLLKNDKHKQNYEDLFGDNNLFPGENPFLNDELKNLDLGSQIPLRRYQKDKTSKGSEKFLKTLITLLFLSLLALVFFLFFGQDIKLPSKGEKASQTIAVSSSIEAKSKDGKKGFKVIFNTANGKEVSFLSEIKDVENGRVEFEIDEADLYSYNPQINEEGKYEVILDAIITAPNLPKAIERVSLILSEPYNYAPFTLLLPSGSETEFFDDITKISFKIEPHSLVTINGEDCSGEVKEDGRFEKEFSLLSGENELILDIRISTPGFLDNIQQIILKKPELDVMLKINENSPILSDEQWVNVTGTTHPEAILESNVDIFEEPEIDGISGDFSLYLKADYPGYTPCILTARQGEKESSMEIILERRTTADTYTSTAWEPDFDQLKGNEELSNGRHFVFRGEIRDIIESGQKNTFTVNIDPQGQGDQFYYVEFWGDFDFEAGDKIRVFANRWGNKDGYPRFLAKYIYH